MKRESNRRQLDTSILIDVKYYEKMLLYVIYDEFPVRLFVIRFYFIDFIAHKYKVLHNAHQNDNKTSEFPSSNIPIQKCIICHLAIKKSL